MWMVDEVDGSRMITRLSSPQHTVPCIWEPSRPGTAVPSVASHNTFLQCLRFTSIYWSIASDTWWHRVRDLKLVTATLKRPSSTRSPSPTFVWCKFATAFGEQIWTDDSTVLQEACYASLAPEPKASSVAPYPWPGCCEASRKQDDRRMAPKQKRRGALCQLWHALAL